MDKFDLSGYGLQAVCDFHKNVLYIYTCGYDKHGNFYFIFGNKQLS